MINWLIIGYDIFYVFDKEKKKKCLFNDALKYILSMAYDIWLWTTWVMREEMCCNHFIGCYPITRDLLYAPS